MTPSSRLGVGTQLLGVNFRELQASLLWRLIRQLL